MSDTSPLTTPLPEPDLDAIRGPLPVDLGTETRRWLVDKYGEATVIDFEYAFARALVRAERHSESA